MPLQPQEMGWMSDVPDLLREDQLSMMKEGRYRSRVSVMSEKCIHRGVCRLWRLQHPAFGDHHASKHAASSGFDERVGALTGRDR